MVYGPEKKLINGKLIITGDGSGILDLKNLEVKGDLIVDLPNATVKNHAKVDGYIRINDISENTWIELIDNNKLIFASEDDTLIISDNIMPKSVELKTRATLVTSKKITVKAKRGVKIVVKAPKQDKGVEIEVQTEEDYENITLYDKVTQKEIDKEIEDRNKVKKLIDDIETLDNLSLKDAEKVALIREEYNSLEEDKKLLISNMQKLEEAEAKIKALEEVEKERQAKIVENILKEIKSAGSLEDLETIEIDKSLSETNKSKLDAAKKAKLEEIERDRKVIKVVEEQISVLGEITLDSKEAVEAARTAYNDLTEEQKQLVKNLEVLESAENRISILTKTPYIEHFIIDFYDEEGNNKIDSCLIKNPNKSFYFTTFKKTKIDLNSVKVKFTNPITLNEAISKNNVEAGEFYVENVPKDGLSGILRLKEAELAINFNIKSDDGVNWYIDSSDKKMENLEDALVLWNKMIKPKLPKSFTFTSGIGLNDGVESKEYKVDTINRSSSISFIFRPEDLELKTINYQFISGIEKVSIPKDSYRIDPIRDLNITGYRFEGWYLDKDFSDKFDENTLITEDISLFGKWISDGKASIQWYEDNIDENIYRIKNESDLIGLSLLTNGSTEYGKVNFKGKTINLENNINLENVDWTAISETTEFQGIFDGRGHIISNLTIKDKGDSYGFFGKTGTNSIVKNLTFKKANISAGSDVGVVVGWAKGNIINVHVEDYKVNGSQRTGGIVGQGIVNIKRCSAINGEITGFQKAGGIAAILNNAKGNNIEDCYSDYKPSGFLQVDKGGLIGYYNGKGIKNSYVSKSGKILGKKISGEEINNLSSNDLSILKNPSKLKELGWDSEIWIMEEGQFPRLNKEYDL